MFKKMLVPLDVSELSEITFNYVRELAGRFVGLEVILLHVCREKSTLSLHGAYVENTAGKISAEARKALGNVDVNVRGVILKGNPTDEILRYASSNGVDLILMATHGRSGISRWAMGSVAYKVLCLSEVPVLLVRAGIEDAIIFDQLPERRLLVALDGTRSAESILSHVEALAAQWGKEVVQIILIRVCRPADVTSDYPSSKAESWEMRVEQEKLKCKLEAGSYLANVEKHFKEAGFKVCSNLPFGNPAQEILNASIEHRANLIAMVIHGRSGISRWAYGNTAEEVMLGARVPIMLVRP
ncbi:MAG: universal stress protein [Dehalococcoidia bacterium]|nr:universal stress protein [Dehalococcoidia bacterium]